VSANELGPLDDDTARAEVGWVAREARALSSSLGSGSQDAPPERWAEYYDRKARLLTYLDEPELAAASESMAAAYRPGGAYHREPPQ
jgi:hypothetical protein